jgi:hypothetical protein
MERLGQSAKSSVPSRSTGLALLLVNVIGAVVYVVAASNGWRIPKEQGVVPITGEPFVWFISILPIVAIFSALNLAWGVVILSRRQWHGGSFWLMAALVWIAAVCIDFAHH